jgi:RNA polymerase sigma-70 factor (ECF subfamily)
MADSELYSAVESEIRAHCLAGERQQAATRLLETYGRELLRFLISHLRDRDAAEEVFARFTESVWRSLDAFRWQCTARAWCYALARHAALRYLEEVRRGRRRQVPLSESGALAEIADRIRTETRTSARTETKHRIAALSDRLPEDDRMLLMLRITRNLEWKEIAQIMASADEELPAKMLEREAARLRKRYQLAKDQLRKMAREEGLYRSRTEE